MIINQRGFLFEHCNFISGWEQECFTEFHLIYLRIDVSERCASHFRGRRFLTGLEFVY